ncbi:MAG: hypothetical protein RRX93_06665 [Bacteroidales bacterium]
MIFAGIDIGSNAVRILFAEMFEGLNQTLVTSKVSFIRVPLRLGEDVFSLGYIREESTQNLIETLLAFKMFIAIYKTTDYAVYATAAMREASNKEEVVAAVLAQTGMQIQIIGGLEEANVIRLAGNIQENENSSMEMFVDVGGGSTEISVTQKQAFINSNSFALGTLRLLHHAEDPHEWMRLQQWLHTFKQNFGHIDLVGSGGNINKITKLFGEPNKQHITFSQLRKATMRLEKMTLEERMLTYKLRPDRADVILPAAKLFLFISQEIESDAIIVPKFGLADGIVCKLYQKYQKSRKDGFLSTSLE